MCHNLDPAAGAGEEPPLMTSRRDSYLVRLLATPAVSALFVSPSFLPKSLHPFLWMVLASNLSTCCSCSFSHLTTSLQAASPISSSPPATSLSFLSYSFTRPNLVSRPPPLSSCSRVARCPPTPRVFVHLSSCCTYL